MILQPHCTPRGIVGSVDGFHTWELHKLYKVNMILDIVRSHDGWNTLLQFNDKSNNV